MGKRPRINSGGWTDFAANVGRSVSDAIAVANAYRDFKGYTSTGTQTSKSGRMYGMSSSRLAGKRYRGRRIYRRRVVKRGGRRRVIRKMRQPYKSQMKSAIGGYSTVAQDGNTLSDPNSVFVNAKTFNAGQVRLTVVYALLKKLLKQAGIDVSDENEFIDRYGNDSRITLTYRPGPTSPSLQTTMGGIASPGNTFKAIGNALLVLMANVATATVEYEQLELFNTTGSEKVQLNIANVSMKLYCKTSLKMQNRSLNAAPSGETQSDDLDRCPVAGKVFRGYGTGPLTKDTENTLPLLGTGSQVSNGFAAGSTAWTDVPDAVAFKNVTASARLTVNPGSIRTEIMSHTMYISLNSVMQKIHIYLAAPNAGPQFFAPLGKFIACSFEKVIGNVSGNSQNVIIVYEGEDKVYCTLYNKYQNYTKRGVFSVV